MLTISVCIGGPIAYFGNNAWLQNFPNRVALGIGTVLTGTILLLLLGLIAIGWQVWIPAKNDPIKVLRAARWPSLKEYPFPEIASDALKCKVRFAY